MKSSTVLENIFSSEVMKWRYCKCLLLSFFVQILITTLTCSFIQTLLMDVIWNPFVWIYSLAVGIVKPYWILRSTIPAICYLVVTRIHVHAYEVTWWVPEKRVEYIKQLSKLQRLLHTIALTAAIAVLFQYYVYLVNPVYTSLSILCGDDNKTCVNHQALLVWLLGIVFGFRFSLRYFLDNLRCIRFCESEPTLVIHIKSKFNIRSILESCLLFDVGPQVIFYCFGIYCSIGLINGWWAPLLSTESAGESSLVALFWVLFDLRFMLSVSGCLVLLAFNIGCFFTIFQHIVSQRIELPLLPNETAIVDSSNSQNSSLCCLNNALVSSSHLLKLLAFKQLKEIAVEHSSSAHHYRSQIFAISQPGGHPRTWQGIVNPSLNLIRNFCSRLRVANGLEVKSSGAPLKPNVPSTNGALTDCNKNAVPSHSDFSSKFSQVKERLLQYPIFYYFLSELPDAKNRQIFADSQTVIWAIEALANLAASSFKDDDYGVVQRYIADILTVIVQLQLVMDKIGRGLPHRKGAFDTNFGSKFQNYPLDVQLRRSLRLTIRSSIYVITNTFKETIKEIPLEDEVVTKLNSYLNFQEG